MNDETPKPTIQQAIENLKYRDEYKSVVSFIRESREALFSELGPAETPNEVMKLAGGIARLDELLQVLDPQTQ